MVGLLATMLSWTCFVDDGWKADVAEQPMVHMFGTVTTPGVNTVAMVLYLAGSIVLGSTLVPYMHRATLAGGSLLGNLTASTWVWACEHVSAVVSVVVLVLVVGALVGIVEITAAPSKRKLGLGS